MAPGLHADERKRGLQVHRYPTNYNVSLRDGFNLVVLMSRGRRKSKKGNTPVPMICTVWATVFAAGVYASCTWYEIRRCVFDCGTGHENDVAVRSPAAVHQPHTYTVAAGTNAGAWSTAAVVPLLLYCCMPRTWY